MRLSELFRQLNAVENVDSFAVYLAAPDSDGVDVDLASIGRVEVDFEQRVARIYPDFATTDDDSVDPEPVVGMLLEQLPMDATADNDLRIVAELPLLREEGARVYPKLADVVGVHVGKSSGDVWLLMRPAVDFAEGLLPD